MQVGLQHTSLGTRSYHQVCMASNIPPPSVSGKQYTSNKVAKIMENKNKKDMKMQKETVERVQRLCSLDPKKINVQANGVYNNRICSGIGKTPFQPAMQSNFSVTENETFKAVLI